MKRRETVVIPMQGKKKLGTVAKRSKGKFGTSLDATQFALERAVKRIAALEKQADGLARLSKDQEIETNKLQLRIKRLEERERGRDYE
jgi:hypothetical protein